MIKNSYFTISIILTFISIVFASEEKSVAVEIPGLEKTIIEGALVYYEPCFKDKLEVFKEQYLPYKKQLSNEDTEQFISSKDQVYQEIEKMVGGHEKLRNIYDRTIAGMLKAADVTQNLYIKDPTFFLIKKETIKDYLRRGGRLANFSYDKECDTAEYKFVIDKETTTSELSIPISSVDSFDAETKNFFKMLTDLQTTILLDVIIHEACEMCLAMRLDSKAPYIRWFRDGVAEQMTYSILHKHFDPHKAKIFLANRSVDTLDFPEKQVNLQHWMLLRYTIGNDVPIESENDLTNARYRYSFLEAKRLVDSHGADCVYKIVEEFSTSKIKDGDALYQAIQQVTGEDLQKRFERYQTFGSKMDGLKFYVNEFNKSQKEKKPEAMLFNALRSFELHISPIHPGSWTTRKTISVLLFRMGHKQLADEAMKDFVGYISELNIEEASVDSKRNFMAYAIETDRPELGYDYAKEVLEKDSKEPLSLTIVMLTYAKENKLEAAKSTAEMICEIVPDKNSRFYQLAKDLLSR